MCRQVSSIFKQRNLSKVCSLRSVRHNSSTLVDLKMTQQGNVVWPNQGSELIQGSRLGLMNMMNTIYDTFHDCDYVQYYCDHIQYIPLHCLTVRCGLCLESEEPTRL